jgi:soluble lytic murein transglycosylase-like protein
VAEVTVLASTCQSSIDPRILVGIARHESGLVTDVVHLNRDGSRDYGLMQINERNFGLLGLTPGTALDPCRSIAAAARLLTLFSRYNTGSSSRGIENGYALAVAAAIPSSRSAPAAPLLDINDPPSDLETESE